MSNLTERTYRVAWDDPAELDGKGIAGGPMRARLQLAHDEPRRLQRWNGFVCPHFSRAEIDRYIAFVAAAGPEADYDRAAWDGDVLVVTDPFYEADAKETGETYEPERIEPTDLMLYPLGSWGWTWTICEPDGDIPQDACEDLGLDGRDGRGIYRWQDV